MDTLSSHLRFAFRSLRKNPGFTAVALITLALGIGANTAIFSVVHAVMLRPLPYPRADELVRVWPEQRFTEHLIDTFTERVKSFSALSGYTSENFSLSGEGRPEVSFGARVSTSHFATLGVEPALGRSFLDEEGVFGADGVVVLSHGLWQRRFGGDESIVGATVDVGGEPRTVVGVMPAGYPALQPGWQLWVPLAYDPASDPYVDFAVFNAVARLAPGVSMAAARAEVRALSHELHDVDPARYWQTANDGAGVVSLHEAVVGSIRPSLLALLGAVALVLLIACANVSNLQLARAASRQRELAVRAALGAGKGRLIAQLMTESLLISVLGGALGLLAAAWTLALLNGRLPAGVPRAEELTIDVPVLTFALAASLLSALVFGLAPAWRTTRFEVFSALKSSARGALAQGQHHRLHHALVAAEIALAVVVVVGAGLLVKSFWRLHQGELGFRPEGVLTLRLSPIEGGEQRLAGFYDEVAERVSALPGVVSASTANMVPLGPGGFAVDYSTADHQPAAGQPAPFVNVRLVGDRYLETLGVPILNGRPLRDSDRVDAPAVGLINRAMARQLWGEAESVGREVRFGDGSEWFTVAGVVGDMRQQELGLEPSPEVYLPYRQAPWTHDTYLVVRATADPAALTPAVRTVIWSIDGNVAISRIRTMEQVIRSSVATSRFLTALFSVFALLALGLGAIGVYGVTSYAVSQRTYEHGIRLALGATGGSLLRTAMGRGLAPVAAGLAAGAVAAAAVSRGISSLLYEVTPTDPAVFAVVAVVLGGFAVLATWVPARRAARVDPVISLRGE